MKHKTVKVSCHWDINRINVLFTDKEISIDLNMSDAVSLLKELKKAIADFEKIDKDGE